MTIEQTAATLDRSVLLSARLARTTEEVRAAQRLRWQVFCEEQGARLSSPVEGLDIDDLDQHCEHLIVSHLESDNVIGTYRLLTADAARRAGGYYSEREFEFDPGCLAGQRLLELGRSCVHREFRTGATIALLWSGLSEFLIRSGHSALIGCASIPFENDAVGAARLAHALARTKRSMAGLSAQPRSPLPMPAETDGELPRLPPLLKGYFRSGALVAATPYWDRDFKCADLLLHLNVAEIEARYARKFIASAPTL